ncbi:MAG: hypothetical protein H6551_03725 [Chitinophagales bacterium]|nr:hypothetical protein [Chitinophagaceae bacterium]MCB9064232.1 hypothetical protein [Chitinophagales bacterium]
MRFFSTIYILLFVLLSFSVESVAYAQGFSYVYIQGDKQTPFYVKLDDMMLPRYGKNYYIIPQLAPGTLNIEILFQQNKYPSHKFTIKIPENGFRGFLLMNKAGTFTLYDIHQKFYLQRGNKAEDDNVPSGPKFVYTNSEQNNTPVVKTKNEPRFIENIELNNSRSFRNTPPATTTSVVKKEDAPVRKTPELTGKTVIGRDIHNSDCPVAMPDNDFTDLLDKVEGKNESVRLKYLLTKMGECYTTNQARMLAATLTNDPEMYTFFKKVYSRIVDQSKFVVLEDMLTTQEWKSYFRLITSN